MADDSGWDCAVCGVDTFDLGEDFYVHNDLWRIYGVEGMLCIGCLEARMGRRLTPGDFKCSDPDWVGGGVRDGDPNFDYRRSERFNDRVRNTSTG